MSARHLSAGQHIIKVVDDAATGMFYITTKCLKCGATNPDIKVPRYNWYMVKERGWSLIEALPELDLHLREQLHKGTCKTCYEKEQLEEALKTTPIYKAYPKSFAETFEMDKELRALNPHYEDLSPLPPCNCGGKVIIDVSMALIYCEHCGLSFEYRYCRGVIPYYTWQQLMEVNYDV